MEKAFPFAGESIPWYDSTLACALCLILLGLVLGFSALGVRVGWETSAFFRDLWIPGLLGLLSALVMLSLAVRMARRLSRGKGSFL